MRDLYNRLDKILLFFSLIQSSFSNADSSIFDQEFASTQSKEFHRLVSEIDCNEIQSINIGTRCLKSFPCQHSVTVILNNGTTVTGLDSFQISSIVKALPKEKINPEGDWDAESIITHFAPYSQSQIKLE